MAPGGGGWAPPPELLVEVLDDVELVLELVEVLLVLVLVDVLPVDVLPVVVSGAPPAPPLLPPITAVPHPAETATNEAKARTG
jgi:hypothetical protein